VSGRIHLNWRLIQVPVRLLDYVVAHEVAHLLEMNHSQRFWRTVGRLVPDYAARRKELRREGHRYLLI
jgi:predicted metal-dependent hydrolase